jgi:hypothetical protein
MTLVEARLYLARRKLSSKSQHSCNTQILSKRGAILVQKHCNTREAQREGEREKEICVSLLNPRSLLFLCEESCFNERKSWRDCGGIGERFG